MNKIKSVEELDVFKLAHELTLDIYKVISNFPKEEKSGLVSQLRRSAGSVCANLTEGGNRNTKAEFREALINCVLLSFRESEANEKSCNRLIFLNARFLASLEMT